jgi:predicted SAM-dependent methyltransferase
MTSASITNHDHPIIVMSFNRPRYLEAVLKGLVAQVGCRLSERSISLFQDGAVNRFSGERRAEQSDIDACVQLFQKYFPQGRIFYSNVNVGIALNFERAEKHAFETLNAEAAIFFEDDLEVSPYYLYSLDHFLSRALVDERVGYVAVYGYHRTPLHEQEKAPGKLVLLEHNWGFGLTKRQWTKNRHYTDAYVDLVRNCDYRLRDTKRIYRLFASWGLGCPGDSQDVAKTLACCLTGGVKLNIQACLGKYIGAAGVHMKKEMYERLGYEATAIYPVAVTEFEELTTKRYNEIFKVQMKWATERPCQSEANDQLIVPPTIVEPTTQQQIVSDRSAVPSPSETNELLNAAHIILTGKPVTKSVLQKLKGVTDPMIIRQRFIRDPALFSDFVELRISHEIGALRAARSSGTIKLVLGAAGTSFPGWVSTNAHLLNLLKPETWLAWLDECSVEAMLAEHVWDHFDEEEALIAARTCHRFLAPGKHIRIAVPDAFMPDPEYLEICKVGGRDGHKMFYDYKSLSSVFENAGFSVSLLEYWEENGVFNENEWSSEDGHIGRSHKFDPRNNDGKLSFTSLIVDAIKAD